MGTTLQWAAYSNASNPAADAERVRLADAMRRTGERVNMRQAQALWGPYYFATPVSREREREALLDALTPDDHISTLHWAFDEYAAKEEFRLRTIRYYTALLNAKAGRTNEAMTDLQALARKWPRTGRAARCVRRCWRLSSNSGLADVSLYSRRLRKNVKGSDPSLLLPGGCMCAPVTRLPVRHRSRRTSRRSARVRAPQLRAALRLQQAGQHLRHDHQFEARNPHSYLHIEAVDENGRTQEYVCESHGVTQLTRNGITPQMLKAGTEVRVDGSLSRHNAVHVLLRQASTSPTAATLNVNGPTRTAPRRRRSPRARTSSAPGCSRRCRTAAPAARSR